jgi:MbtH protein
VGLNGETAETYVVVVNDEGQYSILRQADRVPPGWLGDGFTGTKDECLEHIDEVWQDMRPRSLRRLLEGGR